MLHVFSCSLSREPADLVSPSDRQDSRCVQSRPHQPGRRASSSNQNPPSGQKPLRSGEQRTCEGSNPQFPRLLAAFLCVQFQKTILMQFALLKYPEHSLFFRDDFSVFGASFSPRQEMLAFQSFLPLYENTLEVQSGISPRL